MTILSKLKQIFEWRNYAVSNSFEIKTGQPIFTTFSVAKSVKEGYKINPIIYRLVNMISKSGASVPWGVVDTDSGEAIENHYLTELFNRPHPNLSRQDVFELLIAWLELTGNAFLNKVKAQGRTQEMWPISPDRIGVVPSTDPAEWIKGYVLDRAKQVTYEPEEVVHFKFFDPSNPLMGIGPLQAGGHVVDIDNAQSSWAKAQMDNGCIPSGIVSFKREFTSQDQADAIALKMNERDAGPTNARRLKIVGSEAKFQPMSMTPAEIDFQASQKGNLSRMCIVFSVPEVYVSAEKATYSNFQASELIFWLQAVIPTLDDMADSLNLSFRYELKPKEKIAYDISKVPAMRRALYDRAETAKMLFNMGVPFSDLNRIFNFNVTEYEGWDNSYVTTSDAGIPKASDEVIPEGEGRSIKKNTIHLLKRERAPRSRQNAEKS